MQQNGLQTLVHTIRETPWVASGKGNRNVSPHLSKVHKYYVPELCSCSIYIYKQLFVSAFAGEEISLRSPIQFENGNLRGRRIH